MFGGRARLALVRFFLLFCRANKLFHSEFDFLNIYYYDIFQYNVWWVARFAAPWTCRPRAVHALHRIQRETDFLYVFFADVLIYAIFLLLLLSICICLYVQFCSTLYCGSSLGDTPTYNLLPFLPFYNHLLLFLFY